MNDPRFMNPRFKAAVRTVLHWFGMESNMGNFKLVESKVSINWMIFADNINNKLPEPEYLDWKKCEAEWLRNKRIDERCDHEN